MKLNYTRIVLFSVLSAMALSCSEDDDAKSSSESLEKASLSFAGETKAIDPPAGLASSQDEHAITVNTYIATANAMTSVLSYFTPPSGAVKSSTRITGSNGRVAATNAEYLVYTWTSNNISVAYQISEASDKWVFEIFYKEGNASSWLSYVYAEEKKDKTEGLMKIYNVFGDGDLLYSYTWKRANNVLTLVLSESFTGENITYTISISEKTGAGSVAYALNGVMFAKIEWDAKGNGSWVEYEDDGKTIVDQGTWTVK